MRILKKAATFIVMNFCILNAMNSVAQESASIIQDDRFEQILNEKRKINSSITVNDNYKIQIFYGDNGEARKTLSDFKREFKHLDGTIIFQSPTYKVWIGNFKTKIEAEKNLADVKRKYPYALLIKPNK